MIRAILVTEENADFVKQLNNDGGIFTSFPRRPFKDPEEVYFVMSDDPEVPNFFMPASDFFRTYAVKNHQTILNVQKI